MGRSRGRPYDFAPGLRSGWKDFCKASLFRVLCILRSWALPSDARRSQNSDWRVVRTTNSDWLCSRAEFVRDGGGVGPFGPIRAPAAPPGLQLLESWAVIGASTALFAIEFLADKIPAFDLIWNALHTFIRVPVAAILAYRATSQLSPEHQLLAALLGAAVALIAHGGKTAARVAVTPSPEPLSNFTLSLGEDVLAIGLTWLATRHPVRCRHTGGRPDSCRPVRRSAGDPRHACPVCGCPARNGGTLTGRPPRKYLAFQLQESPDPFHFRLKLPVKRSVARLGRHKPEIALQLCVLHGQVCPADHSIAPKHRQGVIAPAPVSRLACKPQSGTPIPTSSSNRSRSQTTGSKGASKYNLSWTTLLRGSWSAGQYQLTPSTSARAKRSFAL